MSICVSKEAYTRIYTTAINDQRPNELMMTFIVNMREFSWYDDKMIKNEMKMWRRLAKENKIIIRRCNNKTYTEKSNGRTYYTFVVQSGDDDNVPPCLTALFIYGMTVSGVSYVFTSEINRDIVLNYVMKGIEVDE